MAIIDNFLIEVTLKKRKFVKMPDWFEPIVAKYKQYESEERIVLDIPRTWEGFKDGTVITLLKHFGEAIWLALAYVSDNDDIVVDFEGNPVDKYTIVIDGMQKTKYVKKRIRVVKVLNKAKEIFEVKDFLLDFEYLDSIILVFSAYCVGSESTFKFKDFVKIGA
jgi:hypothetical protein